MLIDLFLNYLRTERNYSDLTIVGYGTDLREFEAFFVEIDEGLKWDTVDADLIRRWIVRLMDEKKGRGMRPSSVNRKLSSLRSFYRFLLFRGYVTENPVRKVKGPKRKKTLPFFLKESEMDQLLDGDWFGDDFCGCRDRMILEMFYSTGIRLSELIGLDDADVDFYTSCVKVTGKRNKQRLIPFGEELRNALLAYIEIRNETLPVRPTAAFFVRTNGKRMYQALVYNLVRKNLSKVTALKKRSPHVLRHTFATSMLNHSAGLESVKELLGHSSLATTEIYTHTTFEELKKVYKQAHPRA